MKDAEGRKMNLRIPMLDGDLTPISSTSTLTPQAPIMPSKSNPKAELWEMGLQKNRESLLVRKVYQESGFVQEAMDQFDQKCPSVLLIAGAMGSGKTYFLHYIAQKYFTPQFGVGPHMICIKHFGNAVTSTTHLYGIQIILRTFVQRIASLLLQKIGAPNTQLMIAELDFIQPPENRATFHSIHQQALHERDEIKKFLVLIFHTLSLDAALLWYFNNVLDVDFPRPERTRPKPTLRETIDLITVILVALSRRMKIRPAFLIDDIQYLDSASWTFITTLVEFCPQIFVAATTSKQEGYPYVHSLISWAVLSTKPFSRIITLKKMSRTEVWIMLNIKFGKYRNQGISSHSLKKMASRIAEISDGNAHHASLIIDHLLVLMECDGENFDTFPQQLRDTAYFSYDNMVLQLIADQDDHVKRALFLLARLGDFHHMGTLDSILRSSSPISSTFLDSIDLVRLNSHITEPIFHEVQNFSGTPNYDILSRKFGFRNLMTRLVFRQFVHAQDAQSAYHRAYAHYHHWHKFNEESTMEQRTVAFPLMMHFFKQIQVKDPKMTVRYLEQAFFHYYKRDAYPEALFFNDELIAHLCVYPQHRLLITQKEAWLRDAVEVQTRLRIGTFHQRLELCAQKLSHLEKERPLYPSTEFYSASAKASACVFWIGKGLSIAKPAKNEEIVHLVNRYDLERQFFTYSLYADKPQDHYLSLCHSIIIGQRLHEFDIIFLATALAKLGSYMVTRNYSWSSIMTIYHQVMKFESSTSARKSSELVDDFYLQISALCIDLGLLNMSVRMLTHIGAYKDSVIVQRDETWNLKSYFILNLSYLAVGDCEGRMHYAQQFLQANFNTFPVSWGICSSMSAVASAKSEFGCVKEALSLAESSWSKFLILMDFDYYPGYKLNPTLFLHDVMYVYVCGCCANMDKPFNMDQFCNVAHRLSVEWQNTQTYYYIRLSLILPAIKMHTLTFFALRFYDMLHGTSHSRRAWFDLKPILMAYRRIVTHRPKKHPLRDILLSLINATEALFEGRWKEARTELRKVLKRESMAKDYPLFTFVLLGRLKMLDFLLFRQVKGYQAPDSSVGGGKRKSSILSLARHSPISPTDPAEYPLQEIKDGLKRYSLMTESMMLDLMERRYTELITREQMSSAQPDNDLEPFPDREISNQDFLTGGSSASGDWISSYYSSASVAPVVASIPEGF